MKKKKPKTDEGSSPKSINDFTADELVAKAKSNHIWLNAFQCVRPTEKFKADLGGAILAMLETTDMRDGLGISKMIILTVNKIILTVNKS